MAITKVEKKFDKLPRFIQESINREIQEAIDEEISKIQERIIKKQPEIIAGILLSAQKHMSTRTLEDTFIFEIKLKD